MALDSPLLTQSLVNVLMVCSFPDFHLRFGVGFRVKGRGPSTNQHILQTWLLPLLLSISRN